MWFDPWSQQHCCCCCLEEAEGGKVFVEMELLVEEHKTNFCGE